MAAYRITVTGGHLTAVNRRDISYMLANGMTEGETRAGIRYTLMEGETLTSHRVRIARNESDDWGRVSERVHSATFTAKATR